MGVVSARVEVGIDANTAFRFIANPKNIELVYPETLRFRVLEAPEKISNGSKIRMEARLLGQRFEWYSIVKDYEEGRGFTDEAIGLPFLLWRHAHSVREAGGEYEGGHRCVIEDRIEFRAVLGPIGDRFAGRIIASILKYRNQMIRKLLEADSSLTVRYDDPTVIGLGKGIALSLVMTILGLLIPIYALYLNLGQLLLFIASGVSWLLLWFFTHDLSHLIVGALVGVRFSNFYIGISNLVRALKISPQYRILFIALGLRIDRERSSASASGFAVMYFAGPLASMLFPFYVPLQILLLGSVNAAGIVILFFLTISVSNLVISSIMSFKYGCIRKGIRALARHR
jgi:ligand-binding SRPBCC domain-containing protein